MIGQFFYHHGLRYIGKVGGSIVLAGLYVISLLYLTNFRLGQWCRQWWAIRFGGATAAAAAASENELERRARLLEKQARQLQEQLDKSGKGAAAAGPSGLGADMQPVPEPTVRDLSVPQANAAPALKKAKEKDLPKEPAPAEEGVVIPAKEIAAATTADILGKEAAVAPPPKETVRPAPGSGGGGCPGSRRSGRGCSGFGRRGCGLRPPPRPNPNPPPASPNRSPSPPRPKSATTSCRRWTSCNSADTTLKPTETKEELMANARLMQQTLAQFDIEVSPGDITKGPTITRYELHPAPGVKLEKIVALSNNIAAALKAERINILAPVPGKSSVGVEVPNAVKTKVIVRDLFESEEWRNDQGPHSGGAGQGRLRAAHRGRSGRNAAPAHRRQHRLGQIGLHQRHHHLPALPVSRPTNCALS